MLVLGGWQVQNSEEIPKDIKRLKFTEKYRIVKELICQGKGVEMWIFPDEAWNNCNNRSHGDQERAINQKMVELGLLTMETCPWHLLYTLKHLEHLYTQN